MPTISVVIPAYNAGKYIAKAFDSLIAQSYTDWECVVVNDGSTDNTLDVIKEYVALEPRIRYCEIENSGSAKVPRDMAIKMARSEWIIALDADDTLKNDTLEKLFDRQRQTAADIVLLRLVFTNEAGDILNYSVPNWTFDMNQILDGKQAALLTIGSWTISGNGLIAKRIFDARDVVKNYMDADEYDTRQMFILAQKVALLVDAHYYYREQDNSITRRFSTKLFDTIYTNKMLCNLVSQTYGKYSDAVESMTCHRFRDVVQKRILLTKNRGKITKDEFHKLKALIKENYLQISRPKRVYASKIKQLLLAENYTLLVLVTYAMAILHKFRCK